MAPRHLSEKLSSRMDELAARADLLLRPRMC
jgi:hypothetical protein